MLVLLALLFLAAVLFHDRLNVRVEYALTALALFIGYSLYVTRAEGFDETVNVDGDPNYAPPRFRPNMVASVDPLTAEPVSSLDPYAVSHVPPLRHGVDGNLWTHHNMAVDGHGAVRGEFDVTGNTALRGNVKTGKHLSVGGDSTIGGGAMIKEDIDVAGRGHIANDLFVGGNQVVRHNMRVNGIGTFNSNVGIAGSTKVKGNLGVGGGLNAMSDAVVDGHLSVAGGVGGWVGESQMVEMSDNGVGKIVNKTCPKNHFVCGMQIRDDDMDDGLRHDHSGVNGMWLQCCPFE